MMKKISLKKLLILPNAIIYDIRDNDEFQKYNIYNSINIPFIELYNNHTKYFNNDNTYYIVCELGYRSKKLIKHLRKYKYNVIYVKRGLRQLSKIDF